MAKSIKFTDNTYIDSTGVTYNQELLSDVLKQLASIIVNLASPTVIESGSDLNDYTTPGFYVYDAGPGDISNVPIVAQNQAMFVFQNSVTAMSYRQVVFRNNYHIYTRNYRSNSWTSWYSIDMTEVS